MPVISLILLVLGIALVVGGSGTIIFVFVRRLPTIALINVAAVPVDQSAKKKEEIIAERIVRTSLAKTAPLRKFFFVVWLWLRERFRELARKIFELERRSERAARREWDALTAATRMHTLEREADDLLKSDKFVEAERKYIEALSIEQKNPKLYEKLGRLYLRNKQYDQARDTLRFASRLSPNDASVVAFLGEVAMAREEYSDAVTYFQHAVSLRPRQPRYLDMMIESCIAAKNKPLANDALAKLAEVNPENAKLADFYRRIKEIS